MEALMLMCLAVAFMVTGKHSSQTAQAAYKAGKEPPGVAKARLRHEAGGGKFKTTRGGQKKPAGPGATRMLIASRWSQACHRAKVRGEHRLSRWEAWYREQAPDRDQQWREKQRKKLERSHDRVERWQGRWTRAKQAVTPAERRREDQAWDENAARSQQDLKRDEHTTPEARWRDALEHGTDAGVMTAEEWNSLPSDTRDGLIAEASARGFRTVEHSTDGTVRGLHQTHDPAPPDSQGQPPTQPDQQPDTSGSPSATGTDTSTGGATMYQQAAAQLDNHADEIEGYQQALTRLGDEMAGVGWGSEVTGPLGDMQGRLTRAAQGYRELAERIRHEGDQVNDAYEEAPWAPDRHVLMST